MRARNKLNVRQLPGLTKPGCDWTIIWELEKAGYTGTFRGHNGMGTPEIGGF